MRPTAPAGTTSTVGSAEVEGLWDRHGGAAYALAAALLGNSSATEAVGLAFRDLARSGRTRPVEQARQDLARQVFRHARDLAGRREDSVVLPPIIAWVGGLARLQRESLALCAYGGLTHHEAAALLEVSPSTVADLLRAALREVGISLRQPS